MRQHPKEKNGKQDARGSSVEEGRPPTKLSSRLTNHPLKELLDKCKVLLHNPWEVKCADKMAKYAYSHGQGIEADSTSNLTSDANHYRSEAGIIKRFVKERQFKNEEITPQEICERSRSPQERSHARG